MTGLALRERRRLYAAGTSHERPATSNLSEAVLVRLWAGQRFPAAALVTRQGAPVRVVHPGFPGRGAGPDFRDAIVAPASGALLRGDVELHVRASDFVAHGHAVDPRYDRTVLHVVFEDDRREDTLLACGRRAPVVALGDWVRRRTAELSGWLASPGLWREPCHDAIARLGGPALLGVLDELGDARFREREGALAAEIARSGPGEALYRALLSGLGYGGLRGAFDALADALPWPELAARDSAPPEPERPTLFEALLLGAAGLLSDRSAQDPYEAGLVLRWNAAGIAPLSVALAGAAARPANHPARRLAGLAQLLARRGDFGERAGALLGPPDGSPAALIAAWSAPASGYWRRYLAPGRPAMKPPGALIGRSRAIELLTNAVLPWAAALGGLGGYAGRAARARGLFARLPRPSRYGALSFLEANLRPGPRPLPLDARRQQGLLALYKTECTQGGCGRCALS
ncbi:MAG: DUF2851 family protein [Dehalococcoidia bacterium]